MVGTSTDIILKLFAEDEASGVIDDVKSNVDGLIMNSEKNRIVLNSFKTIFNDVSNGFSSAIQSISGGSLSDLVLGNASKAETGKALLENIMGGTGAQYDSLLQHIDDVTNENLVSMNMMMPALANFKASTGASNSQLMAVTDTMARFGTYVQATTGSSVLAQSAMDKLANGIHGSYAALQRYKITEDSLRNTGYWDGEESDIEGYLLAVDDVIGETDQLMKTNAGVDQLLFKQFSVAGKSIGNDILPGLKDLKIAFIDWNKSVAQSGGFTPAQAIISLAGLFEFSKKGVNTLGTLKRDVDSLRDGISGLREGFNGAKNAVSGFIQRFSKLSTVEDKAGDLAGSVGKVGSVDDGGIGEGIEKTGDSADDVEKAGEKFDKAGHVNKLKNIAMKFVKAAVVIAGVFLLIAEVLVFVWMEMAIIGEIGKYYNAMKGNIQAGIDGMVMIAPILALIGAGVVLLIVGLDKLKVGVGSMVSGGIKAFTAIAVVFILISEVLFAMIGPILALASVGFVYQSLGSQILAGAKDVGVVSNVLMSLAPFLPLFAVSVLLVSTGIGAVMMVITGSVAIGVMMLLLSEFILGLIPPLLSIASLGSVSSQLSGVDAGVKAISLVSAALKSVESAASSLLGINLNNLGSWISSGFKSSKDQLMSLVSDGGIISGIKDFILKFNSSTSGIGNINLQGLNSLKTVSSAITLISRVISSIQASFLISNGLTGIGNIFGNLAFGALFTPILNTIKDVASKLGSFNKELLSIDIPPVDTSKINNIVETGRSILKIRNTVNTVKSAISSITQTGTATSNNSGVGAMVNGAINGNNSIKPALQQLLNAVDDIIWFNQELASKTQSTQGNTGNIGGITNTVSQISNTIKQIGTTLTNSSGKMRNGGLSIGKNIVQGIKIGMGTLKANILQIINSALTSLVSTSRSKGQQGGNALKTAYTNSIKGMNTATSQEIKYTLQTLTNAVSQFREKGRTLGQAVSEGYREGNDMHSPGIIARSTRQEINYALGFLNLGTNLMYNAGKNLGENLTLGFKSTSIDLANSLNDIETLNTDIRMIDSVEDLETIQSTGAKFENKNLKKGTTIINISEDAVNVDARNMTQRESEQILIQAMEGLTNITEVRT